MKIILASASPRRKELLEQIGIDFEVITSECDEVYESNTPEEIVKELALLKAFDVAQNQEGNCIVIGADTIVVHQGKVLGKPKDETEAFEMVKGLQKDVHEVYTGVAVIECVEEEGCQKEEGSEFETTFNAYNHAVRTKVYVNEMSDTEILDYIASGEPMDKAGAYGIQGRFAAYVEKIEGDYFSVVGLPVSYVNAVISRIIK